MSATARGARPGSVPWPFQRLVLIGLPICGLSLLGLQWFLAIPFDPLAAALLAITVGTLEGPLNTTRRGTLTYPIALAPLAVALSVASPLGAGLVSLAYALTAAKSTPRRWIIPSNGVVFLAGVIATGLVAAGVGVRGPVLAMDGPTLLLATVLGAPVMYVTWMLMAGLAVSRLRGLSFLHFLVHDIVWPVWTLLVHSLSAGVLVVVYQVWGIPALAVGAVAVSLLARQVQTWELRAIDQRRASGRAHGTQPTPEAIEEVIDQLAWAVDRRLGRRPGRSSRVAHIATMIGRELGLTPTELRRLGWAARLHDLGTLRVPRDLLARAPSERSPTDLAQVNAHVEHGARLVQALPGLAPLADLLAQQHEHFDGRGYPGRRQGAQIDRLAQILGLSQVLAGMLETAGEEPQLDLADPGAVRSLTSRLRQERGQGFEPSVVDAALDLLARNPQALTHQVDNPLVIAAHARFRTPPGKSPAEAAPDPTDVLALVAWVEAQDGPQVGHAGRVATWCAALAEASGGTPDEVARVRRAGLLHDIGKAGLPRTVLRQDRALTRAEWDLVRQHPAAGADLLLAAASDDAALAAIVRHHHERPDGLGYPDGLTGEAIPWPARIVALAEALDIMLMGGRYQAPKPIGLIKHDLRLAAGRQFDATLVAIVLEWIGTGKMGQSKL